ncbi:MAG: YitT family protein [Rhodobacteraceae bacterium]|jgi:uncharacterized membrane-anchored protein YitT (DUF2179 family)|nr:YitT family protein [Paracoccaceae bacterium]
MTQPKPQHSLIEDAQGLAFGSTMAALSVLLLTHLGLITGQTAGLAVLIAYSTGWAFGPVFFAINIPFYYLGYRRMGLAFTAKTFVAVGLVSLLSLWLPGQFAFGAINPWVGAVIFGFLSGAGLLALFRHGASLGGIGILGLYLQDHLGWRAGWVQLGFDLILFSIALLLLDPVAVAISFVGAIVVNLVIAINHRRDRYIAT